MPGLDMVNDVTSVFLVTSSSKETAQYHLLQLTPDMVPLFESTIEQDRQRRGFKRSRDGDAEREDEDRESHLCIKGKHSDEIVLCTSDQTYAVREMTQSNSLLLCAVKAEGEEKGGVGGGGSSSKCVAQVCSNVAEIWELSPVVARIGRIAHLLQDSMYHGKEEEEEEEYKKSQDWTNKKLYTPQQISSIVQASPRELQQGLDQNRVLLLDGYYRMIAPSFLLEALQILMNRLDRCGHSYDSVPIEETLSSLQEDHDIRKEVIQAILLQWFGKKKQGDNDEIVELNGQDIVKFIGIQLLESKAKSNQIELQSFLNEWEKTTGPLLSHHIDLPLLKGHYLTFPVPPTQPSDSIPAMVQHFDASDLPLDPSTRLQYLFLKRSQWTLQELTPFLDEIAIDAKKRDAILLKYARSTKVKVPLPETKLERRDRLKKGNVEGPIELLQLYSARLRHA